MAYNQISPGVLVTERDLTGTIPSPGSSLGAFAGTFAWGPVLDPVLINTENDLVRAFGKPTVAEDSQIGNLSSFYTAANFLSYTNGLYVCRVDVSGSYNATAGSTGLVINNEVDYTNNSQVGSTGLYGSWAAKYPGSNGNGLKVSIADATSFASWAYKDEFNSAPGQVVETLGGATGVFTTNQLYKITTLGTGNWSNIGVTNAAVGTYFKVTGATGVGATGMAAKPVTSLTGNNEVHVIVIDTTGVFSGIENGVLERFAYLSKSSDQKRFDGSANYYKTSINSSSNYIVWMQHPIVSGSKLNWGNTQSYYSTTEYDNLLTSQTATLANGVTVFGNSFNDTTLNSAIEAGYDVFLDESRYDIALLPTGQVPPSVAKYVIEEIAQVRKDCVAFVSPVDESGNKITGTNDSIVDNTITFRSSSSFNVSSSYGVADSGFKYQYDKYNDTYFWAPLNGDIAGLCARTDYTNEPWFSPGGLNRGQIKNVIRLSLNPNKSQRDLLYKNGVNPVVTFPGQGTILFGDKTLESRPSAFDRINVRRLFIVLEKAISTAAKYQLFEQNDQATRALFVGMIDPYLRRVQGGRGIVEYLVRCNEQNNTPEIIDNNQFVADIFIKPTRSINFITLNFIASRTDINFNEIG